jgi:hypothetical protein
MKNYEYAIVKFNAGKGALCCNKCGKIIATGFAHEDREHYCDVCMLKQVPRDAAGEAVSPLEKPHRGRIAAWRKIGRDNDERYEGVFLDHPHLTGFISHTSAVLKGPDGLGEIETLNSRYTLIGVETTDDTARKAQHSYDSLPVLQADEGLAYAIAEQNDLSGAMSALMSLVDRTLANIERTEWERRVAAALLFESNWSIMRELAQRLKKRLLQLPLDTKIEIHKQIEAIGDAMLLVIAPLGKENDVPTIVAAAHAIHKSAKWAAGHGEAKLHRAQIITAAWYMRAGGAHDLIDRSEKAYENDDCFDAARMIAEGLHRTIGGRERKREERERAKPEGVVVMPHLGGVATEKQKEIERAYKKLLGQRLPVVRAANLSAVRNSLAGEFPHAAEQIGVLLSDLVEGQEIRFRPTLLVGNPGGGKSRLARRLCAELKLPLLRYDGAGAGDNAFAGTPRRWYSGEHCTPLEAVYRSLKANGAILVDEIDKGVSSRLNGNLEMSLMPFLESETSARYPDPFVESEIDVSHVNFFLTANDDSKLQGPLRDRLRIVRMPEPRRQDMPTLAWAMVNDVARERGGNPAWWPHLNEDELEIAGRLWLGGSVRRLRVIVERLLAAREKNARN